jgi:hypothetical protein
MSKYIDNTIEKEKILKCIIDILEITDKTKLISLKELDENIEKQNAILNLEPEIKKYYKYSRWSYFNNKSRNFKRNYLALIKSLMRDMEIKITISSVLTKEDKKTKCETFYQFNI